MIKIIQIYKAALEQIAGYTEENPVFTKVEIAQIALTDAEKYLDDAEEAWREYFNQEEVPDIPKFTRKH